MHQGGFRMCLLSVVQKNFLGELLRQVMGHSIFRRARLMTLVVRMKWKYKCPMTSELIV